MSSPPDPLGEAEGSTRKLRSQTASSPTPGTSAGEGGDNQNESSPIVMGVLLELLDPWEAKPFTIRLFAIECVLCQKSFDVEQEDAFERHFAKVHFANGKYNLEEDYLKKWAIKAKVNFKT